MKTALAPSKPGFLEKSRGGIQKSRKEPMIRESFPAAALTVSVQGFLYLVDFGPGSAQRYHRVHKNKECSCGAAYCEAIDAVRFYLQAGGARAPDQEGMPSCPICGGKTYHDRNWDGKYTKELGWRCSNGGLRHFLEAKAKRIQKQQSENPWLIPPAIDYPGLRRDDLMTWEQCEAIQDKVFLATGYDPTT